MCLYFNTQVYFVLQSALPLAPLPLACYILRSRVSYSSRLVRRSWEVIKHSGSADAKQLKSAFHHFASESGQAYSMIQPHWNIHFMKACNFFYLFTHSKYILDETCNLSTSLCEMVAIIVIYLYKFNRKD